jgi:hypothetical protein
MGHVQFGEEFRGGGWHYSVGGDVTVTAMVSNGGMGEGEIVPPKINR